jgi:hypothetical protein
LTRHTTLIQGEVKFDLAHACQFARLAKRQYTLGVQGNCEFSFYLLALFLFRQPQGPRHRIGDFYVKGHGLSFFRPLYHSAGEKILDFMASLLIDFKNFRDGY